MIAWLFSIAGGFILRLSTNGLLQSIGQTLLHANDAQAQIALKQIDAEIEARKAARDIRLATADFWEMRFITFVIAGCFTLHLFAVTMDTVFRFGWAVPKFPAPFDQWEGAILLSFFGVQAVGGAVRTIAMAISRRK
jgi:hypothetical protein